MRKEEIKVKGEKDHYTIVVKETHRGPLIGSEFLKSYDEIFSDGIPTKKQNIYSL